MGTSTHHLLFPSVNSLATRVTKTRYRRNEINNKCFDLSDIMGGQSLVYIRIRCGLVILEKQYDIWGEESLRTNVKFSYSLICCDVGFLAI